MHCKYPPVYPYSSRSCKQQSKTRWTQAFVLFEYKSSPTRSCHLHMPFLINHKNAHSSHPYASTYVLLQFCLLLPVHSRLLTRLAIFKFCQVHVSKQSYVSDHILLFCLWSSYCESPCYWLRFCECPFCLSQNKSLIKSLWLDQRLEPDFLLGSQTLP